MKTIFLTVVLVILALAATPLRAQEWPEEYLGLPGDNLNLYAVMKLFQESETLEGFERSLNDENSRINNLDLNGDNLVDYIMVLDYVDDNVHNIILRVALDRNDYQDVAVFTVQQLRDGSVSVQLIGDEDLYGRNYIIEPAHSGYAQETPNPGYIGKSYNGRQVTVVRNNYIEVNAWPLIRFIFNPGYVVWRSSWYWDYNPVWWNPWRPFYWHYYYGYHSHWRPYYHRYFRTGDRYVYLRYNDFYRKSLRSHSTYVSHRIKSGHYTTTYSRPDQRKEGEALYARTHSSRNTRPEESRIINNQSRRPASSSAYERGSASSRSSDYRRPSVSPADRTSRNTATEQRVNSSQTRKSASVERGTRTPTGNSNVINERPSVSRNNNSAVSNPSARRPESPARTSSGISDRQVRTPGTERSTYDQGRATSPNSNRQVGTPPAGRRPEAVNRTAPSHTPTKSASRPQVTSRSESGRTSATGSGQSVRSDGDSRRNASSSGRSSAPQSGRGSSSGASPSERPSRR
jgi:hypothetical protein